MMGGGTGIITGKDPKTQLWVTKFEDGTEDFTTDPQNDKDYKLLDWGRE